MSTTVYTGVWHSYETDRLTLTLDTLGGAFLINAIVIWVHFVAASTWPFCRFALWLLRRKREKVEDVFNAQGQVLLRNSVSSTALLLQLSSTSWIWSRRYKRYAVRAMPYILGSIFVSVAWVVCALFVNYVSTYVKGGMLVITQGPCGFRMNDTSTGVQTLSGYMTTEANLAQSYMQQCYTGKIYRNSCNIYWRPHLPSEPVYNAPCPSTNASNCITTNSTVYQLDTGPLNSNKWFGINAPSEDRIDYRRLLTCSPIYTDPFTTTRNTTGVDEADCLSSKPTVFFYNFGPSNGNNYTYEISDIQAEDQLSYSVRIFPFFAGADHQAWSPSPSLYDANDSDLALLLISAGTVEYNAPVYDPIFMANQTRSATDTTSGDGGNRVFYTSNNLVTAIFCKEQHFVCVPDNPDICTTPVASLQLIDASEALGYAFTAQQSATIKRISRALPWSNLDTVILGLGSDALLASLTVSGISQTAALPNDHWQKEVQGWFNTSLALLQKVSYAYAAGQDNSEEWPYVNVADDDSDLMAQCKNQRVPATRYYVNFNFVALLVLFGVGAMLILFGCFFDSLVHAFTKIFGLRDLETAHKQWVKEGLLQLHKAVLEERFGVGGWEEDEDYEEDEEIPTSNEMISGYVEHMSMEGTQYGRQIETKEWQAEA